MVKYCETATYRIIMNINDKILNTLFLNLSEGIIISDNENNISLITPKVYDLLDVSNHNNLKSEVDLFLILKKTAAKPGMLLNIKKSIDSTPSKSTTNIIELNNGMYIDLSSYPILDKKEYNGRIWLLSDITESIITAKRIENYVAELKNNEERINRKAFDLFQINAQLEKSKENLKSINANKDKFFSIIAHDLKSPFTAFLGTTSMLYEDYDEFNDGERKELINSINSTAKNIYGLLDNLLDWAQIQTGKLEFSITDINISELVNSIIELLKPLAYSKRIIIENEISEFTEVSCDPNIFSTIIRNLFSNAIKFTPENGKITLRDEFVGNRYKFSISDTGIGLTKDEITDILRNGNHKTSLGTNKEKGTGLGLMLTKELVEKHNGQLSIKSKKGKGSTFEIIIPQ